MPTRSLIAFTAGLDSTYVLHEELKKGHDVEIVYAQVGQSGISRLAELSCRRRIIRHFNNLFPGQIREEWIVPNMAMNVRQRESSRTQMVQQYNTLNALIQVMVQGSTTTVYRPMTGWHYQDVLENNPGDWQSIETYELYKQIFSGLVRSIDVTRAVLCKLLTPAWDVEKQAMWESLDEWAQMNLCVPYDFSTIDHRSGTVTMRAWESEKRNAYLKQGMFTSPGITTHYDLLSDLDRVMLGLPHVVEHEDRVHYQCKALVETLNDTISNLGGAISTTALNSHLTRMRRIKEESIGFLNKLSLLSADYDLAS